MIKRGKGEKTIEACSNSGFKPVSLLREGVHILIEFMSQPGKALPYSISKFAVRGLTLNIGMDVAPHGINVCYPGTEGEQLLRSLY